MKIVIDIPEKMHKAFVQGSFGAKYNMYDLVGCVMNGIPLPKGHRKLIAEPTEEDIAKTIGGQNDFAECIRGAVKAVFDNAPAIIEADNDPNMMQRMQTPMFS